jgi:hypothetical protein
VFETGDIVSRIQKESKTIADVFMYLSGNK